MFLVNLVIANLFSFDFSFNNNCFVIVFEYKVFEFFDCYYQLMFFVNLVIANLFSFDFSFKSNCFVIVFEYKVFEFFDCHIFYSAEIVQNIHDFKIEKQKC